MQDEPKETLARFEEAFARLKEEAQAKGKPGPKRLKAGKAASRAAEAALEEPHYLGHRDRLREAFDKRGEHLADYEILELLLFRSIPRRDVKPLAKQLIARFGSLAEVLAAPREHLLEVQGIGESVAQDLKIVALAGSKLAFGEVHERSVIGSWQSVLNYLHTAMAFCEREEFRALFLDKKNGLIKDEVMQTGTIDHTPVYPREIIRRAITLNASAVILAHNHPSGDPSPSKPDIEMTREIIKLAEPLGIVIHDHVIIGRKGHVSFRALGLI
jgi:DNA repair protein RadC